MMNQNLESIKEILIEKYIQFNLEKFNDDSFLRNKSEFVKLLEEKFKKDNLTPIEEVMALILLNVRARMNLLRGGDFFNFIPQCKVKRYRVDFEIGFLDGNYVIECDGHDFHEKTKEQVIYDKKRERFLISEGLKVLRFSGTEIIHDFLNIIDELCDFFESEYIRGCLNYPKN